MVVYVMTGVEPLINGESESSQMVTMVRGKDDEGVVQ